MELKRGNGSKDASFASVTSRLSAAGGLAAGILLCVVIVIMNYEVIMRYFFRNPTIWVYEVTHYLLAAVMTWGLAWGLKVGAHITVEILTSRLSIRMRGWLEAATSLLTAGVVIVLLWIMSLLVLRTLERHETSGTLLAVPLSWPQAGVVFGLLLFAIQAVVLCWKNWRRQFSGGKAQ